MTKLKQFYKNYRAEILTLSGLVIMLTFAAIGLQVLDSPLKAQPAPVKERQIAVIPPLPKASYYFVYYSCGKTNANEVENYCCFGFHEELNSKEMISAFIRRVSYHAKYTNFICIKAISKLN